MAPPKTPDALRKELHRMADWVRFPRMDLVGAGRRARTRFEARQDRDEATFNAQCEQLRTIAELPDTDLQWLIDNDWQPQWPRW